MFGPIAAIEIRGPRAELASKRLDRGNRRSRRRARANRHAQPQRHHASRSAISSGTQSAALTAIAMSGASEINTSASGRGVRRALPLCE